VDGFFMLCRGVGVTISLDEHKPGGVVRLLDDIKAYDSSFFDAVAGVIDGSRLKRFYMFGFDVDKYMDDKHRHFSNRLD
jgi:hypothetical protein